MNTPAPIPPASPGLTPNTSTTVTGAAGAFASLIIMLLGMKGITFPAGAEALIAVVFSTVAGYIPKSGRS